MGLDRFVPTATVVAVEWLSRSILFVEEPSGYTRAGSDSGLAAQRQRRPPVAGAAGSDGD